MKVLEVIATCFIAAIVFYALYGPYFSLFELKDIARELECIRKEMEKLNEGIRQRDRLD